MLICQRTEGMREKGGFLKKSWEREGKSSEIQGNFLWNPAGKRCGLRSAIYRIVV